MMQYVEMKFRITNSGNTNMIRLYKVEKGTNIAFWSKCGLNGKVVMWDNPINHGNGTYNNSQIILHTAQPTASGGFASVPFAKLIFSKEILSCTTETMGTYIEAAGKSGDNQDSSWQAVFLGCRRVESSALLNKSYVTA